MVLGVFLSLRNKQFEFGHAYDPPHCARLRMPLNPECRDVNQVFQGREGLSDHMEGQTFDTH